MKLNLFGKTMMGVAGYALYTHLWARGEREEVARFKQALQGVSCSALLNDRRIKELYGCDSSKLLVVHVGKNDLLNVVVVDQNSESVMDQLSSYDQQILTQAQGHFLHRGRAYVEAVNMDRAEPLVLFWNEQSETSFWCLLTEFLRLLEAYKED